MTLAAGNGAESPCEFQRERGHRAARRTLGP
jgi:hypothetical protein